MLKGEDESENGELNALAAQAVQTLDPFRAQLSVEDMQRRRHPRLSERQQDNLLHWGYAHVMDDFHFHVTLTGTVKAPLQDAVRTAAQSHFASVLPTPFVLDTLTLARQRRDGMFCAISRLPLAG